jgi:V/A-type H+/Na+-transporting ATPase subunit E
MPTKTLDTGQDKIEKIADLLRRQTLEPAEAEAQHLIDVARADADQIRREASQEAEETLMAARSEIERERRVFLASLTQASKQALELLRQYILREFFSQQLDLEVAAGTAQPQLIARLLDAIVQAIQTEGLRTEVSALIPKTVTPAQIIALLAQATLARLGPDGVQIGDFAGGAQVRLRDRQLVLDISDEALRELLKRFVRKDFRKALFGEA